MNDPKIRNSNNHGVIQPPSIALACLIRLVDGINSFLQLTKSEYIYTRWIPCESGAKSTGKTLIAILTALLRTIILRTKNLHPRLRGIIVGGFIKGLLNLAIPKVNREKLRSSELSGSGELWGIASRYKSQCAIPGQSDPFPEPCLQYFLLHSSPWNHVFPNELPIYPRVGRAPSPEDLSAQLEGLFFPRTQAHSFFPSTYHTNRCTPRSPTPLAT